jgi:peptide/nickel transport system substrate-binding protein
MRLGSRASWIGGFGALAMLATTAVGTAMAGAKTIQKAAPTPGGTIVTALTPASNIAWYSPIENPANQTTTVADLLGLLWEPLIYVNDQDELDFTQSIASKVTYNTQGTVYHVFMNPKWHWSDGQPITSADAVWSIDLELATEGPNAPPPWPSSGEGAGGLPQDLKSVVANGPYEFTITLNTPKNQAWFTINGIGSFSILPKHIWDKYSNMTEEMKYVGKAATSPSFDNVVSGPFLLKKAIENQSWTFVPNPNYDGHKSILKQFILKYEASDSSEFADLKTGAVQVGYLPAADWSARLELPETLIEQPALVYAFTWPNMKAGAEGGVNKIFSNLYVREALEMGIDDSAILSVIYHNQGTPQYGPFPEVPKTQFADPAMTKPYYPFDIAKGKALLEAHGWHEVDGVMTKGSEQMKFTLMYPSGDIANQNTQELIQADWAKMGVQLTLEPTPFATLVGDLPDPGKWELVGGIDIVYGGTYPSGETLFYDNQDLDENGWNNAEENKLILATESPAPSAAVNLQRMYAYFEYTAKELPALFMPSIWADAEVAKNIGGYTLYTSDPITNGALPQYWYIESNS